MARPVLGFVILATTTTAFAQPAQPVDVEWEDTSYQSSVIAASAIGAGLWFAGSLAEGANGRDTDASNVLFTAGMSTMFLGAPVVHAVNGEWGRAVGSFGMRFALASVGGLAGVALSTCNSEEDWLCELDSFGPGMLIGASLASVIDAALLTDQKRPRQKSQPVWSPTFAASPSGGQVGIAGTF